MRANDGTYPASSPAILSKRKSETIGRTPSRVRFKGSNEETPRNSDSDHCRSQMRPWIAALGIFLAPGTVCAQEAERSWPGLATSGLSTVYVLDDTGVETSGRFLRLNPDSLDLLVDGAELRFEAADVRRIQKRGDALRNGALIGALVGLGMGLVAGGISDCPGDDPGGGCPGTRAALVLFSTGIYTAIGVGVDALVVGRTTLYEAPNMSLSMGHQISAPWPNRRRAAVNLNVRW